MSLFLGLVILLIGYALGCRKMNALTKKDKVFSLAGIEVGNTSEKGISEDTMKWVCLCLYTVALILRLWSFGSVPYGMNQDEAMAAVDAKALADYGTDRFGMRLPVHFTAWGYGQMSVLLSYCMVPFIKLLGFHPVSIRLPMLLASMLGIGAVYYITRIAFGKNAALYALIICTFNPWHFMQSRWSLDCNMFPHVFALGVLFLILGMKKKKWIYISMFFFAMCMYCYGISIYTVPFFLLVMCIYLLRKKVITLVQAGICVVVYAFFAWPFYLTMAINTFRWNTVETPLFTIPFFPDSVRSKDILFFSDRPMAQLGANIKSLWSVFVDSNGLSCNYVEGYAPIFIFLLPFGVLGLVLLLVSLITRKEDKTQEEHIQEEQKNMIGEQARVAQMAVFVYFLTGVLAGVLTNYVNVNRVNIIFYPVILLVAAGISYVVTEAKRWSVVLIPMVMVASTSFLIAYFGSYASDYRSLCYPDFIEAVQYLEETGSTAYVITPDSQYYGSYHVSEIMTLYAQEVDARFFQNLYPDENGLFYSDKYQYARASEILPFLREGTGCVIRLEEREYMEANGYTCVVFGNYAVATKAY